MVLNPDPIAELETQKNNLLTCQFKWFLQLHFSCSSYIFVRTSDMEFILFLIWYNFNRATLGFSSLLQPLPLVYSRKDRFGLLDKKERPLKQKKEVLKTQKFEIFQRG